MRVQTAFVFNKYVLSMYLQQEAGLFFLLVHVSVYLSIFILFYANLEKLFCSVFYFVANITYLFQIIKCTLRVIAGAYIILMQNYLMCIFKISHDKTYHYSI